MGQTRTRGRRDAILAVVRDHGPIGSEAVARIMGYGAWAPDSARLRQQTHRDLVALHKAGEVERIEPIGGMREIGWYLPDSDPTVDDLEAILRQAAT